MRRVRIPFTVCTRRRPSDFRRWDGSGWCRRWGWLGHSLKQVTRTTKKPFKLLSSRSLTAQLEGPVERRGLRGSREVPCSQRRNKPVSTNNEFERSQSLPFNCLCVLTPVPSNAPPRYDTLVTDTTGDGRGVGSRLWMCMFNCCLIRAV